MQKSIRDMDGASHNRRIMSVKIEHFGPIQRGEMDLKPLTLFVGPNGCGKSHAATLLYAISRLEQDYERARFHPSGMLHFEQIKKEAVSLEKKHQVGNSDIIHTDILGKIAGPTTDLERMFADNFGVPNRDLIQRGRSHASLHISTSRHDSIKIRLAADDIKIQGMNPPRIRVLFDKQHKRRDTHDSDWHDASALIHVPPHAGSLEIYDALVRRIIGNPCEDYNAYYFPAERAGLMLAYRSLVDHHIGHYNKGRTGEKMPAAATDYLRLLNSLPDDQGAFAPITHDAEKTILRGKITAKVSDTGPDIYFQNSQNKYPVHMAASSVRGLAAFFLYLRFVAEKNDLIVLESPEANLHPRNQIELAKFIVRLINRGLYIVLTTNSPYFLEQVSHCVMSGQASQTGPNNVLPTEESLSEGMVAAHKFEPAGNHYKIKRMHMTEEGIPQDEFLSIDDEMYLELSKLRHASHHT